MTFNFVVLVSLSLGLAIGAPLYILFRNKMVRRQPSETNFSRRNVLRLTLINLTLNTLVGLLLTSMFMSLVPSVITWDPKILLISLLLLLFAGITYYGNGIYITSIILESYTLPQLQRIKEFKTQFIATHLFHGPISHVLIYSGWPLAIFFLGLFEQQAINPISNIFPILLAISATIAAIAYSIGQIYNHTYPYQMITNIIIGLLATGIYFVTHTSSPVYNYSWVFSTTSGVVLVLYTLREKVLGKKIDWYL